MRGIPRFLATMLVCLVLSASGIGATQLYGPVPYRSFQDSPFAATTFTSFQLEDFEDHLFNVPGVTSDYGRVDSAVNPAEPWTFDSVDADDGAVDGACIECDAWFHGQGWVGITFTFQEDPNGDLPTYAGVVWTDGFGTTTFEVYDGAGGLLGVVGPVTIANNTHYTSFDDDHFFGAYHEQGIGSIHISNTSGGIELDHLQFGMGEGPPPPPPGQMYGPNHYLSFQDSPFSTISFTRFQLEDFEDHALNIPGVAADVGIAASIQYPAEPETYDSVDADDGAVDGACTGCDSWFHGQGGIGITFTFLPDPNGSLPTHAGVVWTDGFGTTSFRAHDGAGQLLGSVGPVSIANGTRFTSFDDDHFFGVASPEGVGSIHISNTSGGIELDHLQFGIAGPPPPVQATATINPTTLNVRSQGVSFSMGLTLMDVSDPNSPVPIDGSLLQHTFISTAGTAILPDPLSVPCPAPDGSVDFERGISDNADSRVIHGNQVTLRFNTAPDGDCVTLNGDRQDLVAVLADVVDGSTVPVCVAGIVGTGHFEACTEVTVNNKGNR